MKDKIQHFIICAGIVITFSFFNLIIIGIIAALIFAFLKELYDSTRPNNKFDWWDILADVLGIVFALILRS